MFSSASFISPSSPSPLSSSSSSSFASSSLTDRLSYNEYEKKILLAGNDAGVARQKGGGDSDGGDGGVGGAIEVPKMPDVNLLHPAVVARHLPGVMVQVEKLSSWTLHFLARLGL